MNEAVFARLLPFFLCLPLCGLFPRLVAGLVFSVALSLHVSPSTLGSVMLSALVAEVLLGAALGVLTGIPVHAARGLRGDGPVALGLAGRIWAWALFFAMGGPALLLAGLGRGLAVVPAGAWPEVDRIAALGALLFYGPLVFGLPLFLAALLVEPVAALVDRIMAGPFLTSGALGLRGVLAPAALLLFAPFLADELRGLFVFVLT